MLAILTALLCPVLCGYFFVSAICPSRHFRLREQLFTACLGSGIRFGLLSVLLFLWLVLTHSLSTSGFSMVALLLFLVVCIGFVVRQTRFARTVDASRRSDRSVVKYAFFSLVLLATILGGTCAVLKLVQSALSLPHGNWDAWAIWNMHARCLFRSGPLWTNVFLPDPLMSHPYYPLLLPASITACWTLLGHDTMWVPILIGLFFPLAIVLLAVASLSIFRTGGQGLLAGLTLLSTPAFLTQGSWQMADIPLAFFELSTIVCLCLSSKNLASGPRLAAIAGLTAGMAAWTKNEGMLFAAITALVWCGHLLLDKFRKRHVRTITCFLAGLLPVLMFLSYYKLCWAPPDFLLANQGLSTILPRAADWHRYQMVLSYFAVQAVSFGEWKVNLVPALLLYVIFSACPVNGRELVAVKKAALILALTLLGDFLVYFLIVPVDLSLYLIWGVNRLFMQLWPSSVFVYFLLVRPPEQIFSNANHAVAAQT